jgi:hypothetical protein
MEICHSKDSGDDDNNINNNSDDNSSWWWCLLFCDLKGQMFDSHCTMAIFSALFVSFS